ncbi:hypothetical protein HDU97_010196 [Phlyctochytrium planicorne]|nr:hypothetical protein HDU97_010196 [Phlyctochytrium planicorne]
MKGDIMSSRETAIRLPDIFSPLERILLTANGNVQRILSAYHNAPVTISIIENTERLVNTATKGKKRARKPSNPKDHKHHKGESFNSNSHQKLESGKEVDETEDAEDAEAISPLSLPPISWIHEDLQRWGCEMEEIEIQMEEAKDGGNKKPRRKVLAVFDRLVDIMVLNRVACKAWSVVTLSDEKLLQLVVDDKVGIGQLFRLILQVLKSPRQRKQARIVHVWIKIVSILSLIAGFITISINKEWKHRKGGSEKSLAESTFLQKHYTTYHGVIGVGVILVAVAIGLIGGCVHWCPLDTSSITSYRRLIGTPSPDTTVNGSTPPFVASNHPPEQPSPQQPPTIIIHSHGADQDIDDANLKARRQSVHFGSPTSIHSFNSSISSSSFATSSSSSSTSPSSISTISPENLTPSEKHNSERQPLLPKASNSLDSHQTDTPMQSPTATSESSKRPLSICLKTRRRLANIHTVAGYLLLSFSLATLPALIVAGKWGTRNFPDRTTRWAVGLATISLIWILIMVGAWNKVTSRGRRRRSLVPQTFLGRIKAWVAIIFCLPQPHGDNRLRINRRSVSRTRRSRSRSIARRRSSTSPQRQSSTSPQRGAQYAVLTDEEDVLPEAPVGNTVESRNETVVVQIQS